MKMGVFYMFFEGWFQVKYTHTPWFLMEICFIFEWRCFKDKWLLLFWFIL